MITFNRANLNTSSSNMGLVTMVGGSATVSTSKVTNNSLIFLTINGGTLTNIGSVYIASRNAGTDFTINSSNILDVSNVGWILIEPT